ncbi:MAG: HD domain-containing protein [Coriobacteriales bacterium]|nr:HD domain-containing protein [Coriobacteriales bacterium]
MPDPTTGNRAPELFEFDASTRDYLREGLAAQDRLLSPYATRNADVVRKHERAYPRFDAAPDRYLIRPPFLVDVEKILHNPFFTRNADKTQVFSLCKNDDITRRSYHLQLVSQIARRIGRALRLNLDLIEAIALGHDAGHTPFGHRGEYMLNKLYFEHTQRYFNHNVHSVRILKDIAYCNLTLQTYDGMICHCGERAFREYVPNRDMRTFEQLEAMVERCYVDQEYIGTLRPATLEGCVVRISDILAYIGKDRQDLAHIDGGAAAVASYGFEERSGVLGSKNIEIVDRACNNIIKCSIEKPYLAMDDAVAADLERLRKENGEFIYYSHEAMAVLDEVIWPMMQQMFERLLQDYASGDPQAPIYRHFVCADQLRGHFEGVDPATVVCDYIASMTDDYFIELFRYLFPDDSKSLLPLYRGYFD